MATQPFLPFDDEPEPAPATAPGPAIASSRLIVELARACGEQPLDEKILVAPSLLVGHQLVERLGREGHAHLNLRVETVRTLAHALVGPDLARDGWKVLSRAQALALVEQACSEALKPASYFGALRERPGLHRALQKTLEELRAAGIAPDQIPAAAFADRRKPVEIRAVLSRYLKALTAGRAVDSIEILRRAIERVERAHPAGGLLYLKPADLELSALERRFLEGLAGARCLELATDAPEEWALQAREAKLFRAIGEENEIREALRRILAEGISFDEVEILHTDASVYPALAWELSREHGVACTFAGGIAVTYTHPGQGALAFLEWIADGFAADRLREGLASGALTLRHLPGGVDAVGSRAAARALREAKVGWGRRRHISALDRLIADLEGPERPSRRDEEPTEEEKTRRAEARARRLAGARRARQFTERALALAPDSADPADYLRRLAQGTGAFVAEFGGVEGDVDAAAKTAIVAVFREIAELPSAAVGPLEAVERLRDAVLDLSVASDRPRAGHVHVAHFKTGGFSGRRNTFLVGLDDARHPGRDLEDPVLLDDERRAIN
ncbi:MAG TPA: hypothetical protein VMT25_04775, partial [Thermoanaerobaculia bacterium]|nr:hypothetical protein [Thermoanaerobaculia bacterium]